MTLTYHWRYSKRGKPFLIGILIDDINHRTLFELPIFLGCLGIKIDDFIYRNKSV